MQFTRMRSGPSWSAAARVRLITAPLAAAYAAPYGEGRKEAIDDVEMIEPPPALRIGSTAYLIPRNTERNSTAMVRSQSSALTASIGPTAPTKRALLNKMSRRPYSFDRAFDGRSDLGFTRHVGMLKH